MKLFVKIFLCSITVITAAVAVLGYVMISGSFRSAFERENDNAVSRYRLFEFVLRSGMLSSSQRNELNDAALEAIALNTSAAVSSGEETAIIGENGDVIFSTFPKDYSFETAEKASVSEVMLRTEQPGSGVMLTASGRFTQGGRTLLLVISRDVTGVFEQKHLMERRFFAAFIITEAVCALVMAAFSYALTKPINQLTKSTRRFAAGELGARTDAGGGGEIGELSRSFNSMADTIEDTINKLELSAKQKDDFTSSFAHELKTPLTSVIGYADMIYQKKDLSREEIRESAGYILNEGMRLEALSLKLMELIVLEKQEFTLIEMRSDEVIDDIVKTALPLAARKGAELVSDIEPAYVRIELDLFKTLVLNLIDNSLKAGAKRVGVKGARSGVGYLLTVSDDGGGIPEDQLSRITEAFYMVDKSRSRKEHGAGLGLAIAAKIASVHGTELRFESEVGRGTDVSFTLDCAVEEDDRV